MNSFNHTKVESQLSIFLSEEKINHIKSDGFEIGKNNSYFYSRTNLDWEEKCFKKVIHTGIRDISIYILSNVIGVDIDYDCGGNSTTNYWLFSDEKTFEQGYNNAVKYVQEYL